MVKITFYLNSQIMEKPIKRDEKELVFERGFTGTIEKDAKKGLGYGLYYCKKVINAHFGDIMYSYNLRYSMHKGGFLFYIPVFKYKKDFRDYKNKIQYLT